MAEEEKREPRVVSRRQFLVGASAAMAGGALASVVVAPPTVEANGSAASAVHTLSESAAMAPATLERQLAPTTAASAAYLVVDPLKCSGCTSCMLACSMVHDKKASLSASRIQISQTPLTAFPLDVDVHQCRQCTDPLCVQNCPTGACQVDVANGNVRTIDQSKCIGCQTCLTSCPQVPHRTVWNAETNKSVKCDLCADAPYLGQQGGPGGKQACVMACPMGALSVVTETPNQRDLEGYVVNLRKNA